MFTLEQYLRVYSAARTDCYIDYMAGARALKKFMFPIVFPQISPIYRAPSLLVSYETQELAKVLATDPNNLSEVQKRLDAIIYTLTHSDLQI